jgi:primosomal protein N' (replication factor Y)
MDSMEILGPAPAPVSRIKAKYRFRTILKLPRSLSHRRLLQYIVMEFKYNKGTRIIIDVDPVSML